MKRELCLEIVRGPTSYTIGIDRSRGVIGRGPTADVRVPFSTISSAHIEFKTEGHLVYFRDLSSTNGTSVNGQLIPANQWFEIIENTTLTIVDTQLIFTFQSGRIPHFTMIQSGTLARKLLMDVLASKNETSDDEAYLEALSGPDKDQRLTLHDGLDCIEIGGATGHFNFPPMTPAVVATILRDGDGFSIRPQETIFLNGVAFSQTSQLSHETEIEMGKVRFSFIDPLEAYFAEIDGEKADVEIETDFEHIEEDGPAETAPKQDMSERIPQEPEKIKDKSDPAKKRDWLLIVVVLMVILVGIAAVVVVLSI